jgi:hypothetical protein
VFFWLEIHISRNRLSPRRDSYLFYSFLETVIAGVGVMVFDFL